MPKEKWFLTFHFSTCFPTLQDVDNSPTHHIALDDFMKETQRWFHERDSTAVVADVSCHKNSQCRKNDDDGHENPKPTPPPGDSMMTVIRNSR